MQEEVGESANGDGAIGMNGHDPRAGQGQGQGHGSWVEQSREDTGKAGNGTSNQKERRSGPHRRPHRQRESDRVGEKDEAFVRRTGWTLPLNWQQVAAWVIVAVMALLHFGLVAPTFPERWQATPYLTVGGCFASVVVLLIVCTTLDPADRNVRYDTWRPLTIDRSQRKHVIMNNHCYFCRVYVSSRAKHCSACNKCVADFDHHCRWMNNCVGGKTYKLFFLCVVSGALAGIGEAVCCLYLVITLFVRPSVLNGGPATFCGRDISKDGAAALLIVCLLLALLVSLSLLQLLGFHIMLIFRRLSTFDYIKMQREREALDAAEAGGNSDIQESNA